MTLQLYMFREPTVGLLVLRRQRLLHAKLDRYARWGWLEIRSAEENQ